MKLLVTPGLVSELGRLGNEVQDLNVLFPLLLLRCCRQFLISNGFGFFLALIANPAEVFKVSDLD